MSRNSSSTNSLFNKSPLDLSFFPELHCYTTKPSSIIYTCFYVVNSAVLLPLYAFILYCGLQKWKQMRSSSSASAVSHSDSFTYHIVFVELIGVVGFITGCLGIYREDFSVIVYGFFPMTFTSNGQSFFHILTCLERYFAVVHPITYRKFKTERGIRIRNVINACVWLTNFVLMLLTLVANLGTYVDFCLMTSSLSIVSFCSLSVLWVLTRPGPGKEGGAREAVDQSKKRAFYTILMILGVLLLRFMWSLIWVIFFLPGKKVSCAMMTCDLWFYLPSSLVLPLLFLNRAGKLVCCRKNL